MSAQVEREAMAAEDAPLPVAQALRAVLSLIRRNAPELSGKVIGDAERALAAATPPEAERAVLTEEQITAMLQELDEICRQHDVYEYGLPLGFDQPDFGITPHAKMIAAVRAAIDASRTPATGGDA